MAIVEVEFTINEESKIENIFVTNPFYPAFDRIVENLVSRSPMWLPAISHNRKVKSVLRLPANFTQRSE
jgi:hypothetical protein